MYCPKCNTTYSVTQTIINLQNLPVDEPVDAVFCPRCGWRANKTPTNQIKVNEVNLFDKSTYYTNCLVEVWENSATGETSVGWYRTEDTKECAGPPTNS